MWIIFNLEEFWVPWVNMTSRVKRGIGITFFLGGIVIKIRPPLGNHPQKACLCKQNKKHK